MHGFGLGFAICLQYSSCSIDQLDTHDNDTAAPRSHRCFRVCRICYVLFLFCIVESSRVQVMFCRVESSRVESQTWSLRSESSRVTCLDASSRVESAQNIDSSRLESLQHTSGAAAHRTSPFVHGKPYSLYFWLFFIAEAPHRYASRGSISNQTIRVWGNNAWTRWKVSCTKACTARAFGPGQYHLFPRGEGCKPD